MAITALEFMVLCSFREHQILPASPRVLELGESNWYGDVPTAELQQEITRLCSNPSTMLAELQLAEAKSGDERLYHFAQLFCRGIVQASEYVSIDPGTPGS